MLTPILVFLSLCFPVKSKHRMDRDRQMAEQIDWPDPYCGILERPHNNQKKTTSNWDQTFKYTAKKTHRNDNTLSVAASYISPSTLRAYWIRSFMRWSFSAACSGDGNIAWTLCQVTHPSTYTFQLSSSSSSHHHRTVERGLNSNHYSRTMMVKCQI